MHDLFRHHGELATRRVAERHHLVAVKYERVHHGPERENGMRYRAVAVTNLARRPDVHHGTSAYEQVYDRLLVRFPLCGVKRGITADRAEYRRRLDDAAAAYREPPAGTLLTELAGDLAAAMNDMDAHVRDPNRLAAARNRRDALERLYRTADTALTDAWRTSLQNIVDARSHAT